MCNQPRQVYALIMTAFSFSNCQQFHFMTRHNKTLDKLCERMPVEWLRASNDQTLRLLISDHPVQDMLFKRLVIYVEAEILQCSTALHSRPPELCMHGQKNDGVNFWVMQTTSILMWIRFAALQAV
jgi:hypothetical protein